MSNLGNVPRQAWELAKSARYAVAFAAGMLALGAMGGDAFEVRADDPLYKQAALALPSAFPVPEVTGNEALDLGIQTSTAVAAFEAARHTSTWRELGLTAVGAQLASCALDAGVERTGWLSPEERVQKDVGFSSISIAWATKFLLDRSIGAEDEKNRWMWRGAAAAFAGAMTAGAYLVEGSNGGKLDVVAHFGGLAAGAVAYRLGEWRKNHSRVEVRQFDGAIHSAAEIARLHYLIRQWQVEHQNNKFSDITSSQKDLGSLEKFYLESGGNFFVAEESLTTGNVVGIVGIKNEGDGVGSIKRMAVVPQRHRQGIATRLMNEAVEWARKSGYSKLVLTTGERENAKPIYEAFGFREVGRVIRNRDYIMELVFDSLEVAA